MSRAPARPTAILIAGPNGAGKSSFYETVLAARINAPFVNAHRIQFDEMQDQSMDAAYRAAEIATKRRADYIAEGTSFVTETVFSHPSKLELLLVARQAGFRVVMFHLGLASADLAVARVAARVTEGGHPVPEEKIRARFQRNLPLIRKAATIADRANVYDASRLNVPPKLLLRLESGMVEYQATLIPEWCQTLYGDVIHRSD